MMWKYQLKELRDDVKENLGDDKLFVAAVTSGDSGKSYDVQILFPKVGKVMSTCQCPQGYYQWPNAVKGFKVCCKHAENLIIFLREKGLVK